MYYQSRHLADYEDYLATLSQRDLTYRCECSRKSLAEQGINDNPAGKSATYPGTCRNKQVAAETPHAIRIKTDEACIAVNDSLQGLITSNLVAQHGDFILKRKDGIIAYPFAVVVDDHLQHINHVVRGCDLLPETPKQIYLQQRLGFLSPAYMHVPIIVDQHGYKLSKQTLAAAVAINNPRQVLFGLLVLLKQNPPDEMKGSPINEQITWGIRHWQSSVLKLCRTINC